MSASHVLAGAYDQVIKFNLKKEYRKWLDEKIVEYREMNLLDGDRPYLKETIKDKEVSSHYFLQEFSQANITI